MTVLIKIGRNSEDIEETICCYVTCGVGRSEMEGYFFTVYFFMGFFPDYVTVITYSKKKKC